MTDVYADIFAEARVLQEQAPEYNIKSSIMFQSRLADDLNAGRNGISEFGKTTSLRLDPKLIKDTGDFNGSRTSNLNDAFNRTPLESRKDVPLQFTGDNRSTKEKEFDGQISGNRLGGFNTTSFQKLGQQFEQPQMAKPAEVDSRPPINNLFQNQLASSGFTGFGKTGKNLSPGKINLEDDPKFLSIDVNPIPNKPVQSNPFIAETTSVPQINQIQNNQQQENENNKWKNFQFN